jgi:hypothetical protein
MAIDQNFPKFSFIAFKKLELISANWNKFIPGDVQMSLDFLDNLFLK